MNNLQPSPQSGLILTPVDVRAARKELARRRLVDFARMVEIPTAPISDNIDEDRFETLLLPSLVRHHELLLSASQNVIDGVWPNLMAFMPPGSAKSTYIDVVVVPWFMARKRRQNVILSSYGSDLARKQGRRARQLVRSRSFGELFDARLSAESSAADEWSMTNGSEYMAGGILSGITGNRADLLVIDDPVKGREEADSETIRKKTRAAYEDDLVTRLKPSGRQILIQTRWHEDDLAGGILPADWDGESGLIDCRDGRQWYVLCIPAEAEKLNDPLGRKPGEFLWPEWFTPEHWRPFKRNPRTWSALYQQRPAPEAGTYFQRAWFNGGAVGDRTFENRRYKPGSQPADLRLYGTSDYAVTDGGGDFTVHRVWGVDTEGDLWLMPGGYRAQATSDAWIDAKIDLMQAYRPFAWFGEGGVIQKSVEPALLRRMKEREVRCRIEWMPSINDKPSRARGFQARAAMNAVHLPEGPEGDAILDEYVRFPAGAHDDDVDCGSLIGRALDMAHPAIVPPVAEPPKPLRGITEMSWDELMAQQTPKRDRV